MPLGPLMIDLAGITLSADEVAWLKCPSVGGVILFARNYHSREQMIALIKQIRAINPDILISVDHEGGSVQRFRNSFTRLPAMASLGKIYDNDRTTALTASFACGVVMAYELSVLGIDFSFAPVLDLDYGRSKVIGDRAFHHNPEAVIKLAGALIDGMHYAGMPCVAKHFPGHGYVSADSHDDITTDYRDYQQIQNDISIFATLMPRLDAIMPAHVIYQAIDDRPAGFSEIWLKRILRQQLDFQGVVFSDDLSMRGAAFFDTMPMRVTQALDAGCDMALICNRPDLLTSVVRYRYPLNQRLVTMRAKPIDNSINITNYINHIQSLIKSLK